MRTDVCEGGVRGGEVCVYVRLCTIAITIAMADAVLTTTTLGEHQPMTYERWDTLLDP